MPEGAQVNQEEWARFYEQFGHARIRRFVKLVSHLPSPPRCKACGGPFTGVGGTLMRIMGKGPSRKNPAWCALCFEMAPDGGATLTVGVLFADVRGSTALAERTSPKTMAETMNRFYSDVTKVIVRLASSTSSSATRSWACTSRRWRPKVDTSTPWCATPTTSSRRSATAGVASRGLEVGVGLDIGPAFVGIVGDGAVRDFTAIGDVVNTAARLQGAARGGQIVMSAQVASIAGVSEGEAVELDLKGKAEPFPARVVTVRD